MVLQNILENAISFSPRGGTIIITLTQNHDTVELQIDDEGPGIAADKIERVFERYFSSRPNQASEAGTAADIRASASGSCGAMSRRWAARCAPPTGSAAACRSPSSCHATATDRSTHNLIALVWQASASVTNSPLLGAAAKHTLITGRCIGAPIASRHGRTHRHRSREVPAAGFGADSSRHPVGRRGHPSVAAVARGVSQAAAAARLRAHAAAGDRGAQPRATSALRRRC